MDKTERSYVGDVVRQELPNYASRKTGTILGTAGALKIGTVLGLISIGALSQEFTGSGNGAMTGLAAKDKTVVGDYIVTCHTEVENGGIFSVVAPDGTRLADATVGVAYANDHLAFSIADGATDFSAGEFFTITVAAGSGKWKKATVGAVDGSQHAAGVLLSDADAATVDVADAIILFRDAQVAASELVYDASADNADKKAKLRADLETLGFQFLASA